MATFTLGRGLIIRFGSTQYTFLRRLADQTVQLQNEEDFRILTVSTGRLTTDILSGKLEVVRDSDTGNHHDHAGNDTVAPVGSLEEHHRARYERAISYVNYMRRCGVTQGQRQVIALAITAHATKIGDAEPPRPSTVMAWLRKFRESGGNPGSLITRNASRRRQKRIPKELRRVIDVVLQQHYFRRNGISMRDAHDKVLDELKRAGQPQTIGLSTIRRIVGEVTPYDRDHIRLGPVEARHKWRFARQGKYVSRPLERVELDHTLLDIYVIDDQWGIPLGRPTITLLVCSFSGYIIGFYISFEGETLARVLQTIKMGIQPKDEIVTAAGLTQPWHAMGLWETLLLDNAMAHHASRMQSIAYELGMELEYSAVRMPWFKPTVERHLGELTLMLPVPGRTGKPGRHAEPIDPQIKACIRFSDLCVGILQWIVEVHPFQINDRKKARPVDLFMDGLLDCPAPVFTDSYAPLDVLASNRTTVTVRHDGLVHEWLRYGGSALEQMRREVRDNFRAEIAPDPYDLGRVYVQHPHTREWIIAPALDLEYAAGLTRTQHKLIRQAATQRLTLANAPEELRKGRLRLQDHWAAAIAGGKRLKRLPRELALFQQLSGVRAEPRVASDILAQLVCDEPVISDTRVIPTFGTYQGDLI
jgi:putative transposase